MAKAEFVGIELGSLMNVREVADAIRGKLDRLDMVSLRLLRAAIDARLDTTFSKLVIDTGIGVTP